MSKTKSKGAGFNMMNGLCLANGSVTATAVIFFIHSTPRFASLHAGLGAIIATAILIKVLGKWGFDHLFGHGHDNVR